MSLSPLFVNDDEVWFRIPRQGDTVKEALNSAAISLNEKDLIIPDPETPLKSVNNIYISRLRTINVVVGDANPQTISTYRLPVDEALKKAKIALSSIDVVTPDRSTILRNGDIIKITRVTEETRTEKKEYEPKEKVTLDKNMLLGEEKVLDEGQPKIVEQMVRIHSENGEETSRKVVKEEVVQESKPRVVVRGTKVVVVAIETGRASWYRAGVKTTAHRTLPFGTRLRVTNEETGGSIIVKVADRGPYIAGRVVDLSADAFRALAPLSKGTILVRVEQLQ